MVDVIEKLRYVAEQTIESTAAITGANSVKFEVGNEVLLKPDFSVTDPAELEIIMRSCITQLLIEH